MAQPHKGDRRLLMTRIPEPAYVDLAGRAAAAGTSVSQYVADLVCLHLGYSDLARDLHQPRPEDLPMAM